MIYGGDFSDKYLRKKVVGLVANQQPLKLDSSDRHRITPALFCVSNNVIAKLEIDSAMFKILKEKGIYLGTEDIHTEYQEKDSFEEVHVFDRQKSNEFIDLARSTLTPHNRMAWIHNGNGHAR